tara:strand:- start:4885 stop:5301 length:417 start_codon:yes stop_codon:yes gene_type:complete
MVSSIISRYQSIYNKAATVLLFNEFQPVRGAASFVYDDDSASGGISSTSGQIDVAKYGVKEIHYQPRVVNSGSLALSIEGRASFMGTWTQIRQLTLTAAQPTFFSVATVKERLDFLRLGVRAASPAASDLFNAYLMLK